MQLLEDPGLVAERLREIEALSDRVVAIEADEDGTCWSAEFAAGLQVLIEWMALPGRLVLTALTGLPAPGRELEVLKTCLSYNALWPDTAGARFAMDGDEGELMFIRELHPETGGGWDLLAVLEQFGETASAWERFVTDPLMGLQPAVPGAPADLVV